ncbi:hypothetical protein PG993_010983 [Apiospora rasikravindrae]|uniref:Archaemetzincin-2 n=1 Tax=Apiospora rasikravindrae TaxID=990691 RepID=A0ABR1SCY7_9PEZI
MPPPCQHKNLQLEPSAYAREVGFEWTPPAQRLAAATRSGRVPVLPAVPADGPSVGGRRRAADVRAEQVARDLLHSFPGPLVLPTDELAWEPDSETQSFQAWCDDETRNRPTRARKTLYVAAVPEITDEVGFMKDWLRAQPKSGTATDHSSSSSYPELKTPDLDDYVAYLGAFYHGFIVKPFPQKLRFVSWEQKNRSKKYQYVGLATEDGTCTRIRARTSPDGVFSQQLNLEDVLDAEISVLPKDAYAMALLVDHDLYEDEEDDFCCGRAYGLNRVCVVSTARYHPILDASEQLDIDHVWPASHCKAFVDAQVAAADVHRGTRSIAAGSLSVRAPMRAAIQRASQVAVEQDDTSPQTAEHLRTLWLSRLVRTVSHELGHTVFLDHCVYYACMMQSTTGMAEDLRQPPYLCPVCLAKVSHKVAVELLGGGGDSARDAYVLERYEALAQVCDRWKEVGMFAGFQAWLRARIEVIREGQKDVG